jgi:2'-5' RNA ligase
MPAPQCGLVILPPAGIDRILRDAQNLAGPAFAPEYPPHLTVKSLFAPTVDGETVARAVAAVCAAARPFNISLGRLTIFPAPQGNFVVLRVAQARQMMRLHRQLVAALDPLTALADPMKDVQQAGGFVPHITLLQHVPDDQVTVAMSKLAGSDARRVFRVEEIALICQEPGCPWQETRRFPLGSNGGAAQPVEAEQVRSCARTLATEVSNHAFYLP